MDLRLRPGDNAVRRDENFSSNAHDFLAYKFVSVRGITGRNLDQWDKFEPSYELLYVCGLGQVTATVGTRVKTFSSNAHDFGATKFVPVRGNNWAKPESIGISLSRVMSCFMLRLKAR